jgi:glycosyltransferase involved in cell wall biosynthesis
MDRIPDTIQAPEQLRRVYLISAAFQGEYEVGFANGLNRNGVPVTVIGSDRSLVERLDPAVSFLNLRGNQSANRSIARKAANVLRYFGALSRTAIREPRAIFHTNGTFVLRRGIGVLIEALWCRLWFGEWWLTVHNLLPHDDESRLNRFVFGIAYRLPQRLFVHTEEMAGELRGRFGIPAARVHVVEHGIDRFVDPDDGSKDRIRRRFSLPAFRFLILLFGNISRYKGVDLLVEAVDDLVLPDGSLVLIAGRSSSPKYATELRQRMSAMKNPGAIAWADEYLPDSDIPDLLAAADCMVLPYRKIDQSGVIFAAKSAGLPVIASDVGSFRSYVDIERDILVTPRDIAALAGGIARMAKRGSLPDRTRHVESARKKFSWQVTLQPYAELVRRRCGRA